ncbi:hypothetical protein JCM10207_002800 [Rhodosporidiobolus poonsookiae]
MAPSSSRKQAHRKRSPSPGPSSTNYAAPSTPALSIKGAYDKPPTGNRLLHSAVSNAAAASAAASSSKPSPAPSASAPATPADARAQFEQQEDYISFDASPEPDDAASRTPGARSGRGTPRDGAGGGGRKGKRKLDERDEERDEEGTRRLRDREKERSTPWCDEPGVDWDKCESAVDMLNAEARAFVSYISPSPVEHELRLMTIELIRRTIKSKYPDADVQCFGSVGTGLYLPGGDIDLVVLCPSMPSPPLKPSSSLLHRLASLLLTSSLAQPTSLVVIAKARVPIVKFTTRYGGFSVDLSVNQRNGVDAAVRVRGMLEDFAFREEGYVEPGEGGSAASSRKSSRAASPVATGKKGSKGGKGKGKGKAAMDVDSNSSAEEGEEGEDKEGDEHPVDHGVARSLVLLLKAFLSQRGMNEVFTGGLGSYSIICMVISFLQLHPRIQSSSINPNRNLGLLFLELLELYGKHFNFDEAGITLRGRGGYFNKHDKGWYRPQQPYLLSIEDPNDPQNDVSGGSHAIIRVRQTLAGGFDTLSATLLQRHSLLASLSNPSRVALSSAALPNADSSTSSRRTQSLLGSIIGMTRPGIAARDANGRLFADGVLQRLVRKTDPASGGVAGEQGKKALQKARREEKDREKRERTIARLERRMEEKEEKRERKERKKRERIEGKAGGAEVRPLVDGETVQAAKAAAASLEGMASADEDDDAGAGFVIDTRGATPSRVHPPGGDDDGEPESRYSLGVPAVARSVSGPASASMSRGTTFTSAGSSSDSDASGASDDDEVAEGALAAADGDVVLGGTGGDFVRLDRVGRAASASTGASGTGSASDSDESEAEVLEALVPASKRVKVDAKEKEVKDKKKAKKAARLAFWGKKGPREE